MMVTNFINILVTLKISLSKLGALPIRDQVAG